LEGTTIKMEILEYKSNQMGDVDAGASPSTFNETKWRTYQHPTHTFKLVLDSKESVSL